LQKPIARIIIHNVKEKASARFHARCVQSHTLKHNFLRFPLVLLVVLTCKVWANSKPGEENQPSLGWHSLPNTKLASVCPTDPTIQGADGCTAVISTWGGAAADTKRNRMILWGGGHTDYYGNEVYELDVNAERMSRVTDWTTKPVLGGTEQQADGRPTSRHTYDNLAYLPTVDQMFSFGGALAGNPPVGSNATWWFDASTFTWTRKDPSAGGHPNGGPGLNVSVYDPNTQLVFVEDLSNLWSYNSTTNTYTKLGGVGNNLDYHLNGVIDSSRKMLFLAGGGQFWAVSIAPGSNHAFQNWSSRVSGCGPLLNSSYPGLAFDTRQKLVVGWTGGDSVFLFNPETKSCTTQTFSGGPGPAQQNGTNGRFAYFPALNVFVVVNDWRQDAYVLRLTPMP
jgi:hypothetical protein